MILRDKRPTKKVNRDLEFDHLTFGDILSYVILELKSSIEIWLLTRNTQKLEPPNYWLFWQL